MNGGTTRRLWEERAVQLNEIYQKWKEYPKDTEGLNLALKNLIGGRDTHELGELLAQLNRTDSQIASDATITVTADFFLTIEDFKRIVAFKIKVEQEDPERRA